MRKCGLLTSNHLLTTQRKCLSGLLAGLGSSQSMYKCEIPSALVSGMLSLLSCRFAQQKFGWSVSKANEILLPVLRSLRSTPEKVASNDYSMYVISLHRCNLVSLHMRETVGEEF